MLKQEKSYKELYCGNSLPMAKRQEMQLTWNKIPDYFFQTSTYAISFISSR